MTSAEVPKADPRDPNVRRLVYNMYRGMLDNYNDQANDIVDSMPRNIVKEDAGIYRQIESMIKQQSGLSATDGGGPNPPPPPFPGSIPGRRLKTEIPERGPEPPAAIQNAMMTKDKKPFTYTPGGLDLSEIRSPRMQRRINRNACADEIPGEPAPSNNQLTPTGPLPPAALAAMQPAMPTAVFPAGIPPPPPPPPSSGGRPPPPPLPSQSADQEKAQTLPRNRPGPIGFDPNEILQRASRIQPQQEPPTKLGSPKTESPGNIYHNEPGHIYVPQQHTPREPDYVYAPPPPQRQKEPGHVYVPQVAPKIQNEPGSIYVPAVPNHSPRGQLGSIYIPPVPAYNQEPETPSTASSHASHAYQVQSPPSTASTPTSPLSVELNKAPTPWMTQLRNQPTSVPSWANRDPTPTSPKASNTRIIPIQIEGRDPPPPPSPKQQPQQQQPNTRVIPIQFDMQDQQRRPGPVYTQNKFNPMTPQSPTPYSPPNLEGSAEQGPQWAPVQSRSFKVLQKTTDSDVPDGPQRYQPSEAPSHQRLQRAEPPPQRYQPNEPEYGNYNTAGVPLSQLRKMQLSEDDRALMNKFKAQADKHTNGDVTDENANPRYRGGHIPSKVFKILDESVDDENYLHRESDPRYRGAAIPSRAFRMLQNMTDTAGDLPQQVPRGPVRNPANRPPSTGPYQQEGPAGPYIPPSEQQVQEPRKYTGGSIPSRSFRMLQAMTGQEGGARNQSSPNSPSGRETPVSGMNRWCPSPAPSPMDPYWGYYPPDPYLIYNYISDLNAAYGFPPPHSYPQPNFPPSVHYQRYHNSYVSDSDEQGYSSTDELAQYYANYRRNMGYPPYQTQPDPYYQNGNYDDEVEELTPPSSESASVTPTDAGCNKRNEKSPKVKKPKENGKSSEQKAEVKRTNHDVSVEIVNGSKSNDSSDESVSSSDEESESDTEVDEEKEGPKKVKSSQKINKNGSLQALKSVSDVNIYTSESSATVTAEEWEDCESKLGDDDQDGEDDEGEEEEEEEDEEGESTSESLDQVPQENLPHQLSVIYEESEHSDVESIRRTNSRRSGRSTTKSITSESGDSTATLDNGADESDDDVLDSEASVTVRLPLQLKFSRTDNDEDVTTVIVGDSEMKRGAHKEVKESVKNEILKIEPDEIEIGNENDENSDGEKSDADADVSFTFSIPTRSNSVITVVDAENENKRGTKQKVKDQVSSPPQVQYAEIADGPMTKNAILHEPDEASSPVIDAEVTVSLSLPLKKRERKSEDKVILDRLSCESKTDYEDDSSSTSVHSGDTVVKQREDTDEDVTEKIEEDGRKKNIESFASWMDRSNSEDWNETEKTAETVRDSTEEEAPSSYEAGVERLEEMISSLLEKTVNMTEDGNKKLKKKDSKDSQEESEEDDSGVTSDMSTKHQNSETDVDTESDFSELSKMTQFQRASTHSRLFKLLQDECEKSDNEDEGEEDRTLTRSESKESKSSTSPVHLDKNNPESLSSRKERLTLPLNQSLLSEADSLSSSSGVTSPSSPTITDRLVKELVQSLLHKKKGKKFRKLPLAKLHAAALRILQEDMDPYDTSSTSASGDDGFFLSPVQKRVHSQPTANYETNEEQNQDVLPEGIYGDNYYDYLDYYNTWGNPAGYYPEAEYDILPSRAFRMLTNHGYPCGFVPPSVDGMRAKCPRILSNGNFVSHNNGKVTPSIEPSQKNFESNYDEEYHGMSFADKRERVSKVLEKSGKA